MDNGRDYNSIHRAAGAVCVIGDTDEDALAKLPDFMKGWPISSTLIGSIDTIRKRIAAHEAVGVQELVIIFPDAAQLDSIRRFAKEFIG